MSIRHYIVLILIALATTAALTPLIRALSIKWGLVVKPTKRKIHAKATPQTGGVAMFIGMAVAIGVQLVGEYYFGWKGLFFVEGVLRPQVLGVFLGITAMFIIGFIDDIIDMNAGVKYLGQVLAASIIIAFGVKIDFIGNPFGGLFYLGWLSWPVTIIYITGFANVINLIDGLDGLAGGISTIAATCLLFFSHQPQ